MTKLLMPLKYFVAVAELESFTAAAHRYDVSQSAISQQIKSLEEEIGTALFLRSRKSVKLTEAGEVFFRKTKGLLPELDQAISETRNAVGIFETKETITIGNLLKYKDVVGEDVLESFKNEYPNIRLKSTDKISENLNIMIDDSTVEHKGYRKADLNEDYLCLAVSKNNAVGRRSVIELDQVCKLPMTMTRGVAKRVKSISSLCDVPMAKSLEEGVDSITHRRGLLLGRLSELCDESKNIAVVRVEDGGKPYVLTEALFYSDPLSEAELTFVSYIKNKKNLLKI